MSLVFQILFVSFLKPLTSGMMSSIDPQKSTLDKT